MHLLCPHCHSPIELVELATRREANCPSCGSSFQLEGASTTSDWCPGPGQRTLGKFELLGELGVGAFGTVYKARDPQLDRTVAIKVPRSSNLPRREDLDRFLREARSAAQLRHPGVVPVHEVGQQDGMPYLVSEFVSGATLADQLTIRRPDPREAARLAAAVADALQYSHEMGVVHRDVKPSNIMLEIAGVVSGGVVSGKADESSNHSPPYYSPRLMDFGLAKREAGEVTMTTDGQVLGTPAYMSPEQAKGEAHRVDGRSDVYSLGAVLYELLTGKLPFRGATRALLHQLLHDEPPRPRSVDGRIPRDLETICLKAMAKEPGGRYGTARELADDLRRFLAGNPIRARPQPAWEQAWRWSKRRPAVAALLVTVVVLTTSGVGAIVWQWRRAEASRVEIERNLYFNRVALAQREWAANNIGRAEELLDECTEHLRGWEWHYLKRLAHGDDVESFQHGNAVVHDAVFSSDGARIATASADGTVKIWATATRREILTVHAHNGLAYSVIFAPDGNHFATGGQDGAVKIWDTTTGECVILRGHGDMVNRLAYSPDGRHLATVSRDKMVKIWDATGGVEVHTLRGRTDEVMGIAFTPDGRHVASASVDKTIKIWDAATGQELVTMRGHTDSVVYVTFSREGQRLASASHDGTLKVWSSTSGQELLTLRGHADRVRSVAYAPDGQRLASACEDGTVRIWDAASGNEALALRHSGYVYSANFSPDGRRLLSAGSNGTVKLWSAAPVVDEQRVDELLTLRGHTDKVYGVAFRPDGRLLASASFDKTVRVWDAVTGGEVIAFRGHTDVVFDVAFSPDGERVASAGGLDQTVRIWNATTGEEILVLRGHTRIVMSVAFSPAGNRLASASEDGTVKVWDTETGDELLSLRGHKSGVVSVAFSPDGHSLASGGWDGTVKVWDSETGQAVLNLKGHTDVVYSVAFSSDGQSIASGSQDGLVKTWSRVTGEETSSLQTHIGQVSGVRFSPDSGCIAAAGGDIRRGEVKGWDPRTGRQLFSIHSRNGWFFKIAFSPDSRRLAATCWDGTVKVWAVRPFATSAAARPVETAE